MTFSDETQYFMQSMGVAAMLLALYKLSPDLSDKTFLHLAFAFAIWGYTTFFFALLRKWKGVGGEKVEGAEKK